MQDPIARIDALTKNARSTWFALLSVLIFVAITMMGVEHIDFYGVDRATKLPLINISVPTRLFFYAAPVLLAAIYGYFHLYLIRLWDALGAAPIRVEGHRLGEAITPWLVTDAALHLRAFLRRDNCVTERAMEWPAAVLNLALAWAFGPVVLGFMWWQSMPARDWTMTAFSAVALIACLIIATASLIMLYSRMGDSVLSQPRVWGTVPMMSVALVVLVAVVPLTFSRTVGSGDNLAPINLVGEQISRLPADWINPTLDRRQFRRSWCASNQIDECNQLNADQDFWFGVEWRNRRGTALRQIEAPKLVFIAPSQISSRIAEELGIAAISKDNIDLLSLRSVLSSPKAKAQFLQIVQESRLESVNFYAADLRGAIFARVDLTAARMHDIEAQSALFEAAGLAFADFTNAKMQDAIFSFSNLLSADFSGAYMYGTNLDGAQMQFSILKGTELRFSQIIDADLSDADLTGANLGSAEIVNSNLVRIKLSYSNLVDTKITGNVFIVDLQGATLNGSLISGYEYDPMSFVTGNLQGSNNFGGALRHAIFQPLDWDDNTDWRNVFLDGTVSVPDKFREAMGNPCQWTDEVLDDKEFFGRWRGWIEGQLVREYNEADTVDKQTEILVEIASRWNFVSPDDWTDVEPIAPSDGCIWETIPMLGTLPPPIIVEEYERQPHAFAQ